MYRIRHIAYPLLAAALLTACTQDESGSPDYMEGNVLTFTVGIDGSTATRSTVDNYFDDGDEISVTHDVEQATYRYDGAAWTTSTPFYWQSETHAVTVEAECFGGEATGDYAVRADQSTFDGYQAGDYLYAPETMFYFGVDNNLTFYHQTAKLMLNLVEGDVLPDEPAVTIGDDNLALTGTFDKPTSGSNFGTWTPGEQNGSITPYRLSSPNEVAGKTIRASYAALVIPQSLTAGSKLISIEIDGQAFSYELPDDITWKPGYVYTYTITVRAEGLEVSEANIHDWERGEGELGYTYAYTISENGNLHTADGLMAWTGAASGTGTPPTLVKNF